MVWDKAKECLKNNLAKNIFDLWIEPLQCVRLQGEQLHLSSPDRFFSAYVKRNFLKLIEEKVRDSGLESARIIFCEKGRESLPTPGPAKPGAAKVQMRLPNVPVNNSSLEHSIPDIPLMNLWSVRVMFWHSLPASL